MRANVVATGMVMRALVCYSHDALTTSFAITSTLQIRRQRLYLWANGGASWTYRMEQQ
jgi:hypothetical protein